MKFEKAAVLGTGMMGPGIAVTLALGGLSVRLVSRSEKTAQAGLEKALDLIAYMERYGLADSSAASGAREKITPTWDMQEAAAWADLVVESAPENMEFKQGLFAGLDAAARPETILTSNTSGLSITAIASRCRHPERVMTTHFWNPPHLMPLVEVVKGEKTRDDYAVAVRDLLSRCGKLAVLVKKDTPGQLGNRMQVAMIREAVNIVAEGIADPADVDLAAKAGFGLRLPVYGIFEHQDLIGLEMGHSIVDYVSQDLYNQPRAPQLMRDLIARGDLGVQTGRGFYDWSKRDPEAVKELRDRWLREFLKTPFARQQRGED